MNWQHAVEIIGQAAGYGQLCARLDLLKNAEGWDLLSCHAAWVDGPGGQKEPAWVCILQRQNRVLQLPGQGLDLSGN